MRRRQGFTLVEMLVTLALVLFIMVILSEAFASGLGTFRQLKAIGDMQERLRSVATIVRHDLRNHYLQVGTAPPAVPPNTSLWLDNPQFGPPPTWSGSGPTPTVTTPTLGFFRIEQGTAGSTVEGNDPQGLPSIQATSHRLYFTIRIPQTPDGQRRENYLSANVPPSNGTDRLDSLGPTDYQASGVYYSQSAEVAYFLRSLGTNGKTPGATQSNPSGTPTQLFALFRRQLVLMDGTPTDSASANNPPTPVIGAISNYHDVSCRPQITAQPPPAGPSLNLAFNNLFDVATVNPNNRCLTLNPLNFSSVPAAQGGPYDGSTTFPYPILGERGEPQNIKGDDLLLTNVVSFSVRVLKAGQYDFSDLTATSGFVYDTGFIGSATGWTNQPFRVAA
ncbi:MAG TPA: prepilin-type N-terminal cleavage/methylation domain-containing protein, partial [Gemmataceae bacterium]|nr:prepilin-type N-terminal cleavage/methylation domain-containing protein [Gemmataceae bacterium]